MQSQMNIEQILEALEKFDMDLPVEIHGLTWRAYPFFVYSYRGYYSHLGIQPGGSRISNNQFWFMLKRAIGSKYTGYKGGVYKMQKSTPVWIATEGECDGLFVVDIRLEEGVVKIIAEKSRA